METGLLVLAQASGMSLEAYLLMMVESAVPSRYAPHNPVIRFAERPPMPLPE